MNILRFIGISGIVAFMRTKSHTIDNHQIEIKDRKNNYFKI